MRLEFRGFGYWIVIAVFRLARKRVFRRYRLSRRDGVLRRKLLREVRQRFGNWD